MQTKKLTLREILEKATPKQDEAVYRALTHKNSARALIWLSLQFENPNVQIAYTNDLAQFIPCSYANAWATLTTFKCYGLLYSDKGNRGAFFPTKTASGSIILKKYLGYAVKSLGHNGYEG